MVVLPLAPGATGASDLGARTSTSSRPAVFPGPPAWERMSRRVERPVRA